jgi:hypothetical protein
VPTTAASIRVIRLMVRPAKAGEVGAGGSEPRPPRPPRPTKRRTRHATSAPTRPTRARTISTLNTPAAQGVRYRPITRKPRVPVDHFSFNAVGRARPPSPTRTRMQKFVVVSGSPDRCFPCTGAVLAAPVRAPLAAEMDEKRQS